MIALDKLLLIICSLIIALLTIGIAASKTFVFRRECDRSRKSCEKVQQTELDVRDKDIERLENKIDETKTELKKDIYIIKDMVNTMMTHFKIDSPAEGRYES